MEIIRTIEFDISKKVHQQITELKNSSFPDTERSRSYLKQLPHFRYLVFAEDVLVGHMGVDHRVISVDDSVFSIFGVIDLCVRQNYQQQGIASNLLSQLTELAKEKSIDFLFLVADDNRIYLKNDFQAFSQECHWLGIEDHHNCGVLTETIEKEFMVKQIGDKPWKSGAIDLLGYMF
jgi:GNAT superfamily N-acetyltransferase